MNREDIIRMARENEWVADVHHSKWNDFFVWFYNRAAAAEREACAKVCESLFDMEDDSCNEAEQCAAAIRARGEK